MRRLIVCAGLSVGLLLSPAAGFAQSAHAPAVAAAPVADAASARKLELARRYFSALHYEETMSSMLEGLDPLLAMGDEFRDEADQADSEAMRAASRDAMVALTPKLIEGMTPIVAGLFTEPELEALVAFYESPVGQSVIKKAPQMMEPTSKLMMSLMPGYLTDVLDRYCAKATCSEELENKLRKQAS